MSSQSMLSLQSKYPAFETWLAEELTGSVGGHFDAKMASG
jgi:hypothetical protein